MDWNWWENHRVSLPQICNITTAPMNNRDKTKTVVGPLSRGETATRHTEHRERWAKWITGLWVSVVGQGAMGCAGLSWAELSWAGLLLLLLSHLSDLRLHWWDERYVAEWLTSSILVHHLYRIGASLHYQPLLSHRLHQDHYQEEHGQHRLLDDVEHHHLQQPWWWVGERSRIEVNVLDEVEWVKLNVGWVIWSDERMTRCSWSRRGERWEGRGRGCCDQTNQSDRT